jgi:putative membrane protein
MGRKLATDYVNDKAKMRRLELMKRLIQFTAATALALAVSACSGDNGRTPDDSRTPATGTDGTVGTSGSLDADRAFVDEQLAMGTAEIELGRLAQERASHADVKEFAATMVREHQMAANDLKPILSSLATTDPTAASRDEVNDTKEKVEDLSKLTGLEFDKKYIDQMIDDHQEAIDDVEKKTENAANPDVKQWAVKTLPKMREHLETAKDIQSRLKSADAPPDTPRK